MALIVYRQAAALQGLIVSQRSFGTEASRGVFRGQPLTLPSIELDSKEKIQDYPQTVVIYRVTAQISRRRASRRDALLFSSLGLRISCVTRDILFRLHFSSSPHSFLNHHLSSSTMIVL